MYGNLPPEIPPLIEITPIILSRLSYRAEG
jgi:hypothetical protein